MLIPIFIRNTIFAYLLEAGRVALYRDEKGPNARSLGSRAESLIMRETQSIFRRIVLRKGLHDPIGIKEAVKNGKLIDFVKKELIAAGLDDASIREALSVEYLAELSREIQSNTDFFDSMENTLDHFLLEPMYQREFGDQLDAKIQEKMDSLGIKLSKTQLVDEALKLPKVCFGYMSIFASLWAFSMLEDGISFKSLFHTALAHDLFRLSCNCYRKTYIIKSVRLMHLNISFGQSILNAVSSAITGRENENTKYLREISVDVVCSGTFFDYFRRWYDQVLHSSESYPSDSVSAKNKKEN